MKKNLVQKVITSATLSLASLFSLSTNGADYITIERGFLGINNRVTHVQTQAAIGYVPQTVLTRDHCGRVMYGSVLMPVQTEVVTCKQILHQGCGFIPGVFPGKIIPLPQNYCAPIWQQPYSPTVIYSQPAVVVQAPHVHYVTPAPMKKSPIQAPLPSSGQYPIQRLPEPIPTPAPQSLQPLQNPRQAPQMQSQQRKYISSPLVTVQPNPHGWRN
ncbi:MAG: hypothetical protein AABX16_04165 [Nanoarchaeota archaeon]